MQFSKGPFSLMLQLCQGKKYIFTIALRYKHMLFVPGRALLWGIVKRQLCDFRHQQKKYFFMESRLAVCSLYSHHGFLTKWVSALLRPRAGETWWSGLTCGGVCIYSPRRRDSALTSFDIGWVYYRNRFNWVLPLLLLHWITKGK